MRAVVVHRYGPPDVAAVEEVPDPRPRRGEVLVRVHAAAVTSGDARLRSGRFPRGFAVPGRLALGLRGPRATVLGSAYGGVVEDVGAGVSAVAAGDGVAGMAGVRFGAHAELLVVRATRAVRRPAGVTAASAAAALFGGTAALWFLRDRARVRPGDRVLVIGAAGSVGSSAVQLARHLGAEVTAVARTRNAALVRGLGAAHVVDRTVTPVARITDRFDVVLDAVGNVSRAEGERLLAPGGRLCLVVADLATTISARGRVSAGSVPERPADVAELLALVERGVLDPLGEAIGGLDAVVEAYRRIDEGHKAGNLVVDPRR